MPPLSSRSNTTQLSVWIGLWLGLTCTVGLGVFIAIFALLGGFNAAPTQVVEATAVVSTTPALPSPIPSVTPAVAPTTSAALACNLKPLPPSGFGYGIQSHVFVGDNDYWLGVVADKLGFQWVKMQVRWYDLEKAPDAIYWDVLDSAMNEACEKGLHVMLSVVAAPEWSRANPMPAPEGQEAPPDDYQTYANFLTKLMDRYPNRIGAFEVWNEMNLEREWNTAGGVSAGEYVKMLATAYNAVKAKDPNVIIISGALAPTGINCNVSFPNCQPTGRPIVVDDVTYLKNFVAAGGLNYVDCIGTHSNGTNLPPAVDGTNPPDKTGYTFTGPWDNPHYSWALKSQVETYAGILQGQKLQCVTEFGYASAINGVFPANYGFAADVSEQEQGEYLVQAFNWMRDSGLVKMAFLFNLDYGPKGGDPASDDNVIFSILNREGAPRPAFDALSVMPKP